MSRYVVTGCAGFVGSHLAEELLTRGHDVVGVDSFTGFYARSIKEGNVAALRRSRRFRFVESDLAGGLPPSLARGAAGLFHLAAQPGVRQSFGASFPEYVRNNLVATDRVLHAAAAADLRVVFASSSSVYGEAASYPVVEDARLRPLSPYGVTKLACEEHIRAWSGASGLDYVVLRYFTVYGPRQRPDMAFARMLTALRAGTPFRLDGDGRQSRDFTYVGDAVAASVAAMERGEAGMTYNVGGGTEATLLEAARLLESLAGIRLDVRTGPAAPGDVRRTRADTSRIRREVGWEPRTSLADGIAAQLQASGLEEPLSARGAAQVGAAAPAASG